MRSGLLLILGAALAACAPASAYRPKVELDAVVNPPRYETDLRDCKRVAERDRYGPVLVGALQGAAMGAALGSIGGWLAGGSIAVAQGYGAASGTVAGTAISAATLPAGGEPGEEKRVDQCLRNNGYKIIG